MELYVVKLPKNIPKYEYELLLEVISPVQKKKVVSYKYKKDSYRSLLSEILVRFLAVQKYKILNDEIHMQFNPYGKPFIKGNPFYFNTSHSGDWVVVITDNKEVGIDVEKIQSFDIEIANHFFTSEECSDLNEKVDYNKLIYFYDLWTLKECFIKNVGKGLSLPLNSFSVSKHLDSITVKHSFNKDFYFQQYYLDESYIVSVCCLHNQFPGSYKTIAYADLIDEFKV